MGDGLDVVSRIEAPVPGGYVHEVAGQDAAQVLKAGLAVVRAALFHLVLADVETDDRGLEFPRDRVLGPAYAATDIQHPHARLQAKGFPKKILVTCKGFLEGLAFLSRCEVKRPAPSEFVEIGDQVVKRPDHGGILLTAPFLAVAVL